MPFFIFWNVDEEPNVLSANGTGTATWVGTSIVSAVWGASGSGVFTAVGRDAAHLNPCEGGGSMPTVAEITESEDWTLNTTRPPNTLLTVY